MQTADNRRWWALTALVMPVLLISMDATVLGFAVPVLSETLEPTSSQLLWIVDIYSFVLAGLLVTMGVVGDRIGRRRLLMVGAAGFTGASLIAAFSTSAEMLIVARVLLGFAGSTLMPSTLSLIRNIFPDDRERQSAIAVWATAFAVGTTIGPILGGFLLEHFWWGSIFVVNVPVTLALIVLAPRLIDESRDPHPGRFDLLSAALSMAAMFPTIYAVKAFAEHGASVAAGAALVLGIVAGVAFVKRQGRLAHPMIDIGLFRLPGFRMAVSGNLLACFGLAGSLFIITQYLQLVVGVSPLVAGVALLPTSVVAAMAMLASPAAARRFGSFTVVATGLAAGAVGFALMTQLHLGSSMFLAIVAISVLNAGLSAAMTVAVDGILAAVPAERAGSGAAVSETANELGIALGTAILGSVMTAVYRPRIDLLGAPAASLDVARESLGAAIVASQGLPDQVAHALAGGAQTAFLDGAHAASVVAAVALTGAAIWATSRARAERRNPEDV
ncbi:MAG TPA: MFS transporter [Acidimicrobiales bacterium]|nr:MFS transporter [Acidimicrobiales bacterium]